MLITAEVIKTDGTYRVVTIDDTKLAAELDRLIGCDMTDRFHTVDGKICWVDDDGSRKNLPVNLEATRMYWQKCGGPVDFVIRGDVVITEGDRSQV